MIKRFLPLIIVVLAGLCFTPNFASLQLALFTTGVVGLVLLMTLFIIGITDKWGILPDINLPDIYASAVASPDGAAKVFQALILLICVVLYVVAT
ncbi:hypothetical protein [Oryzomonas rubra]|uniref:Uncharacterized protein n=1 Tax=Oryzomonas rubra TaxID=2509454 RepID=A0A5A9X6X2_9BACT|nr:hypothetical protein [Oryzomonas rubra]KAA0888786.1 hypothetical protein ET418_15510 [Oryzomonas rubra]